MNLAQVRKTIAALALGLIGWATAVVQSPSSGISATEWIMLATAVAVSLGVYGVPNAGVAPE